MSYHLRRTGLGDLPAPNLTYPADGAADMPQYSWMVWDSLPGVKSWDVEVNGLSPYSITGNWHWLGPHSLRPGEGRQWRVRANFCDGGIGPWSEQRSFTVRESNPVPAGGNCPGGWQFVLLNGSYQCTALDSYMTAMGLSTPPAGGLETRTPPGVDIATFYRVGSDSSFPQCPGAPAVAPAPAVQPAPSGGFVPPVPSESSSSSGGATASPGFISQLTSVFSSAGSFGNAGTVDAAGGSNPLRTLMQDVGPKSGLSTAALVGGAVVLVVLLGVMR